MSTFEEYWDTTGSHQDIADHKERARLAWEACDKMWVKMITNLDTFEDLDLIYLNDHKKEI